LGPLLYQEVRAQAYDRDVAKEGGLRTVEGFVVVFFCEKHAVFGFYRVWQKIPIPPSEREMAIIGFEKGWFAEP
jgi:hypothetical protein